MCTYLVDITDEVSKMRFLSMLKNTFVLDKYTFYFDFFNQRIEKQHDERKFEVHGQPHYLKN